MLVRRRTGRMGETGSGVVTTVYTNHELILTERRKRQEAAVIAMARRITKAGRVGHSAEKWEIDALCTLVDKLDETCLKLRRAKGRGMLPGRP